MKQKSFLSVLAAVRRIDWYGEVPDLEEPDWNHVPIVCQWRFEQEDAIVDSAIQTAVTSFSGNVPWDMWRWGRNWVIAAKRLRESHEFLKGTQLPRLARHIGSSDPSFGRLANADVPALLDHLQARLEKFAKK